MIRIFFFWTLIFWSISGFTQMRMPVKPVHRSSNQVVASTAGSDGMWVLFENQLDSQKLWELKLWNGTFWQNKALIRTNRTALLHSMKFDLKQQLHLVGNFEVDIKGQVYRNMVYWDGSEWGSYREAGLLKTTDTIYAIENHNQKTYIAGKFDSINGQYFGNWAVWENAQWSPVWHLGGHAGLNNSVRILKTTREGLFLTGDFESPLISGYVPGLIIYHDSSWKSAGKDFKRVFAMSQSDQIYVAGSNMMNQTEIYGLNMGVWTQLNMGSLAPDTLSQLVSYEGLLLAVVNSSDSSDSKPGAIMSWDGARWQRVNPAMQVHHLCVTNNVLYFLDYSTPLLQSNLNKVHIGSYQKGQKVLRGILQLNPNGNCSPDPNAKPLSRVRVDLGNNRVSQSTNDSGYFIIYYQDTLPFALSLRQFNPNFDYTLCIQDSTGFNNPGLQPQELWNIWVIPRSQSQAEITRNFALQKGGRVAPGTENVLMYKIQNSGLQTATNLKLSLLGSNKLKNFRSNLPFILSQDSLIVWDLNSVNALDEVRVWLQFQVHDNLDIEQNIVDLGLQLSYFNGADSVQQEDRFTQSIMIESLLSSKEQFVNQELKPNHTIINENDTVITYQINFSAPPNQFLNHVVVIDTVRLHKNLRYTQELIASHDYETRLEPLPNDPNRALLIWTFDHFPDHIGENAFLNHHGFIRFKFVFSEFNKGDSLKNSAYSLINQAHSTPTNSVICVVDKNTHFVSPKRSTQNYLLKLYPNPCQNSLHIKLSNSKFEGKPYFIRDVNGKLVSEGILYNEKPINTSNLLSGTYFITFSYNQMLFRACFIKS